MFALVDGNNFYVSCERVFNPALENCSVVVLSNNDGCVISRSNEAKALGIKMAEPIFKIKELVKQHQVRVFSSNYVLYGDLSNRMVKLLSTFSPEIEVYSIDESFLSLHGMNVNLFEYGNNIRETVLKNIGLPVGVGIAPTKTLAKVANKLAKKNNGVFVIDSARVRDWAIRNTAIEDVWGVGRQYAKLLKNMGVYTAYDFARLDSSWIRKQMSVVGLRIKEELLNRPCISLEMTVQSKKVIATTRAFGRKLADIAPISEAVANHAVRCAEKLRRQHSVANFVTIFIHTDPFSEHTQYINKSTTITLDMASSTNKELVTAALNGLNKIFEPNLLYKKAGVIVSGISNEQFVQGNLFTAEQNKSFRELDKITDNLNFRYGKDSIRLGSQGYSKEWLLKQENLSQRFTTNWDELLKVKA